MNFIPLIFVVVVTALISFVAESAVIEETKSHTYLITPFYELVDEDRIELVERTQALLIDELDKIIPESKLTRGAIELLNERSGEIGTLVSDLNTYIDEEIETNDKLNSVFKGVNLVPSAFMIQVGGKFTVNWKLGGGGSATFAIVVVPSKVIKTNKITKEVEEYYALNSALVVFPMVNVGGGIGGGAAFRAGVGLVWGALTEPESFNGLTVGLSGNANLGFGNNLKLGLILGFEGIKNIYATASWQAGANAEISAHINIGSIISINEFMKIVHSENEDEIYNSMRELIKEDSNQFPEEE